MKKTYLEFVQLTQEEYDKLVYMFGSQKTNLYIEMLNDYLGMKRKKYANHFYVIKVWMRKANIKRISHEEPIIEIPKEKQMTEEQKEVIINKMNQLKQSFKLNQHIND